MTVVTTKHDQLVVLAVEGSIDVLTAPQLLEAVSQELDGRPAGVVIDLTHTDFLASAGMSALVSAHEAIAPTGMFGVVAAGPATARPLTVMGLDHSLILYPTLADALTAMTDPTAMISDHSG